MAKQTLTNLGLNVEVEYDEDTTRSNGVVLKQSIASGETVDEGTTITITVNQLVETKTGTVKLNVKSLTGYKDKITNDDGEEVPNTPKNVEIKVTVNGEQVYKEKVSEDKTNIEINNVSGKGTVEIKVYIDDTLTKTVSMDLNKTTSMTIE